jgi:hypothetical protein
MKTENTNMPEPWWPLPDGMRIGATNDGRIWIYWGEINPNLAVTAPELLEAAERCQITLMKLYRAFKVSDPTEGAFGWIKDVADNAKKAIGKAKGGENGIRNN